MKQAMFSRAEVLKLMARAVDEAVSIYEGSSCCGPPRQLDDTAALAASVLDETED